MPINTLDYFAYGSNMLTYRLWERVGKTEVLGKATLPHYRLVFNKRGKDNSGKATIVRSPGHSLQGVIFRLDANQIQLLDSFEPNYDKIQVTLMLNGIRTVAITYTANQVCIEDRLAPTNDYLDLIMCGARQNGLDDDYITNILDVARERATVGRLQSAL